MSTKSKIRIIVYFCFVYAGLQLLSLMGLIGNENGLELIKGIINVGIWCYLGYVFAKYHTKSTYWITLFFMAIIVLRLLLAVFLLKGMGGVPENTTISVTLIPGTLIAIFALINLFILAQKDVRVIYLSNSVNR